MNGKVSNTLAGVIFLCICILVTISNNSFGQSDFQGAQHPVSFNGEPIDYDNRKSSGPVRRLMKRLEEGKSKLHYDEQWGWLPSLLKELDIPISSQMLLFSKTSLQRNYIAPDNPRSLYFNDDVYVGWIPGAPVMEVSEVDPNRGTVFYDLDLVNREKPVFHENSQCLTCHASARSLGVPGHVLRSVGTDLKGEPMLITAASEVNHRTPISERWGGWYVTGNSGKQIHRGNRVGEKVWETRADDPDYLGNRESIEDLVNLNGYLTKKSDIVALMVHDHQTHMHNLITRVSFETQIMMHRYGHIRYLRNQVNAFLRYLLLAEETELSDEVVGDSGYAEWFQKQGPRSETGRSLRELDLKRRLFKYPCSFLIYSESFDAIPDVMREHLLQRIHDILSGKDDSEMFQTISPRLKQEVLEILVATKPNLPTYWYPEKIEASE